MHSDLGKWWSSSGAASAHTEQRNTPVQGPSDGATDDVVFPTRVVRTQSRAPPAHVSRVSNEYTPASQSPAAASPREPYGWDGGSPGSSVALDMNARTRTAPFHGAHRAPHGPGGRLGDAVRAGPLHTLR